MGCTFARSRLNSDNNPRVFLVHNVDDQGQEFKRGKIEINDHDLILYQKGKDAIRWPLRSLRRYGFDAELFSFESGRRCPTGPGIYAFKCQRAEALFNLLQEFIVRAGQEDHRQGGTLPEPTMPSSRPASLAEISVQDAAPLTTSPHHEYMNGHVRTHEYVNTTASCTTTTSSNTHTLSALQSSGATCCVHGLSSHCPPLAPRSPGEHVIQYAELDLPKTGEEAGEDGASGPLPSGCVGGGRPGGASDEGCCVSTYINVPPTMIKRPSVTSTGSCTAGRTEDPATYPKLSSLGARHSLTTSNTTDPTPTPKMNYVQLDLHNSSENIQSAATTSVSPSSITSCPVDSTAKTDSYAMIDFDRTQALHTRNVSEEEGGRKTRHNSNIEELN